MQEDHFPTTGSVATITIYPAVYKHGKQSREDKRTGWCYCSPPVSAPTIVSIIKDKTE